MQAYVEGVSTRSVDDLVQALGIDSGISKSQVSRICAKLDVEVEAAIVRLVGAVLAEQHDWATHRHYLSETPMAKLYRPRDTDPAPGDGTLAIT